MSDHFLGSTDLKILMELNRGSTAAGPDFQSFASQAAAAAAAHMSSAAQKERENDPGVKMARALEALRNNPAQVKAGVDDRIQALHPARFLGGATCSAKKLWLAAREIIGLDGVTPLSNYDMAATGLGGCVTARGWVELHNPASTNLSLKLFSSANIGGATAGTKRLTLADGDGAINVGESMKEVADMESFKHAVRALCQAAHFALPWNYSFAAIDGFLHSSNYCAAELAGRPDRAGLLVDFTNYVLGVNAAAWQQREPFLTSGEIKIQWAEWFGSRPAALLKTSGEEGGGVGNQNNNFYRGGKNNRGGFQGGRGGFNQAAAGGKPRTASTAGGQGPPQNILFCRRYNNGSCPNHFSNCYLANGTRLFHVCDATNAKGEQCRAYHPRTQHR
jgi:hypothetical protein